jgi:hypothetical protein
MSAALLGLLLLPGIACSTGSLFSGLGYGIIESFSSSRAVAMGNAGLALQDSTALNFANPALLAGMRYARIGVGGYVSRQWMSDDQASDVDDWAQVEYFGLSLPLHQTLALAALFYPYSRIEFRYGWQGALEGVPYHQTYEGIGGLTRASLNLAWSPSPLLDIGAAGSAIWGEVEDTRGSFFDAVGYQDVQFNTSKQWLAFGGIFGIVIKPHPAYSLGFTFEPEVPIHLDQDFFYTTEDSSVATETDYRLAARYGAGFSYHASPTWLLAAQAVVTPWSGVGELPDTSLVYQDSYDLSFGAEWSPAHWKAERFFKRLQYRFGARYESGYVQSAGNPVRGYFGSLGLGYPFHEGRDRFDVSIEFGRRGELAANNGEEQILKLRLGLNFGESWFQRPKPPWKK